MQDQRSNPGHTMTLQTYNARPMSLPSINFLHLMVSEIQPRQEFQTQGHYIKVKSRSHHNIAHLQPLTNVPTKYQLPTPYGLRYTPDKILQVKVTMAKSKVKSRSHHDVLHLHTLANVPTQYQLPTPYGLRYTPDKILQVKVTTARSKVKSRSRHDAAHLQPLTNVPRKYQLPTPYSFRDIAWTSFYRSRSLRQGQIQVTP